MSPWSNGTLSLLLIALGGVHLVGAFEQEAVVVGVTASKYDTRSGLDIDDNKGCFTDGCGPELLIDGILNDVKQSRWSCEIALVGSIEECYATFDLGEEMTLTKLELYFRESNDTTRNAVDFIVLTSLAGVEFDEAFTGVNVPGTPIGEGEDFNFPNSSTGRYVRLQGDLAVDEWMSVNEAIIYHEVDDPDPTPSPTGSPTPSPTVEVYVDSETLIEPVTAAPTSTPTTVEDECSSVTLSGAGELSGTYVSTVSASDSLAVTFTLETDNSTVISQGEGEATCSDSMTDCQSTLWKITSSDVVQYMVYDDADHPSLIEELWISIDDCTTVSCENSPVQLSIVCGDGTASLAPTPSPVAVVPSVCGVLEISGTSQTAIDGLYYDDGTGATTGIPIYTGFDTDGTSNGSMVTTKTLAGACFSSSSSAAATSLAATGGGSSECMFRQWWVSPGDSSATGTAGESYFTYDEAEHPADIVAGGLWYTSTDEVLPYAGQVVIACVAPTTETLSPIETGFGGSPAPSPSPTAGSRAFEPTPDGSTRAPVANETLPDATTQSSSSGSSGSTEVIVGGVVGGVALLVILGAVAYKLKTSAPPPPPPSYNDLVGA